MRLIQNLHRADSIIRGIVGLTLIGMSMTGVIDWWLGLIGLIPLASAIFGWCPVYASIGFSTKSKNPESNPESN